jgi:hypothetical protein
MAVKVLKGCGVLKVDNETIELNDTTNVISVADGVVSLTEATTTKIGGVLMAEVSAVPETFADLDAVQTYLDGVVTALVASGVVVLAE